MKNTKICLYRQWIDTIVFLYGPDLSPVCWWSLYVLSWTFSFSLFLSCSQSALNICHAFRHSALSCSFKLVSATEIGSFGEGDTSVLHYTVIQWGWETEGKETWLRSMGQNGTSDVLLHWLKPLNIIIFTHWSSLFCLAFDSVLYFLWRFFVEKSTFKHAQSKDFGLPSCRA